MAGTGRAVLAAALLAALALVGCDATTPYAPGPSVVPSPGPASPARAVRPADLDLSGDVETTDGLRFHVEHQVWFGAVTSTLPERGAAPVGWTRVVWTVTGSTTVTNTSPRPNRSAGATVYVFYAGYPAGSTLCRLVAREAGGSDQRGDRCWLRLGTAVPYSYGPHEPAQRLAVGASRTGGFDAVPSEQVDAPVARFDEVADALRHPRDIVVLGSGIAGLSRAPYRRGCGGAHGPAPLDRAVIVGASSPLRCAEVPDGL